MDFRIKKRGPGRVGLNMGLLPGRWEGAESISRATYVAEDAFWLLEPGIRKVCDRYTRYAHYGNTAITRDEWIKILVGWEKLAAVAESAELPIEVPELRALPKHLKREFLRDFRRNCAKLSKLIRRLAFRLRDMLAAYDEISVLGL